MRCAISFIRRIAFPCLICGIVAGLWFTASAKAQRDQFNLMADEMAQPIGDPAESVRHHLQLVYEDPLPRIADTL